MILRIRHALGAVNRDGWNLTAGIRAGLGCGVPLILAAWCGAPSLSWAALIALWVVPVDPEWPRARRLLTIGLFILAAALGAFLAVLLRPHLIIAALFAGLWCFAAILIRVWGDAAASAGGLVAVILLIMLGVRQPSSLSGALSIAGMTIAGGLWGLLLALVIGRQAPEAPLHTALAKVLRSEAALLRDSARGSSRLRRGAVREAIEAAKAAFAAAPPPWPEAAERRRLDLAILARAEHLQLPLLALRDLLSGVERTVPLGEALENLASRLDGIADRVEDTTLPERATVARGQCPASAGAVPPEAAETFADACRVVEAILSPAVSEETGPLPPLTGVGAQGWVTRLTDNLNWQSLSFRHAARFGVTGACLTALTDALGLRHSHWITLSAVIVLQAYPSATWQRAIERVSGTVLGGALAALAALVVRGPGAATLLMVPLGLLGMACRSVSYTLYVFCMTPLFLVMTELYADGGVFTPGLSLLRLGDNLAGAALGLLATCLLWPSWEGPHIRVRLAEDLRANSAFLLAALRASGADAERNVGAPGLTALRRAAGLAGNNAEASLRRMRDEPRRRQPIALPQAVIIADAARGLASIAILRLQAARQERGEAADLTTILTALETRLARVAQLIETGEDIATAPPADPLSIDHPGPSAEAISRASQLVAVLEQTAGRLRIPGS